VILDVPAIASCIDPTQVDIENIFIRVLDKLGVEFAEENGSEVEDCRNIRGGK
jgi:hypothetical protein